MIGSEDKETSVFRLVPILLLLTLAAGCNRAREQSKSEPADPKPVAAGPKNAPPAQPAAPPKPTDPTTWSP